MSKRNRREHELPGNDGRWFLELVGAEAPPPDAATTLAELAAPDPGGVPGPGGTATSGVHGGILLGHDGGTNTLAVDYERALAETDDDEELAVWGPEESAQVLDDWEPEELARPLRTRRTIRWAVLALTLLLGTAAGFAFIWLPRVAERDASAQAAEFVVALADLRNELPNTQSSLALVTDPATTPEELGAVIPATAELGNRTHIVDQLAEVPLESRLSFLPDDPMAELAPTQATMSILAASGQDIGSRIGRAYVYRTSVPRIVATPTLPVTVTDSTVVNQLSVSLAASLAESADLVADLPADPAFDATRRALAEAVTRFEPWIVDYLTVLRGGETERVNTHIAELNELRANIDAAMVSDLMELRRQVDADIIRLAGETEGAILSVPTF